MPPQGIMFHHFHGHDHPLRQGSISAGQFEELLDRLRPGRILPAREWLKRSIRGTLREGELCLTFDDNLRCQYDVALTVLRRRGMTAFWFVYSSVITGQIEKLEVYRTFRTCWFRDVDSFYAAFYETAAASGLALEIEVGLERFDPIAYLSDFPFYTQADRRFRFVRDEILRPARFTAVMDSMLAAAGVDGAHPQDKSLQLRYTRNADLTDVVARGYLARLPTPQEIHQQLAACDRGTFLRPLIGSR